jgi:hypothetical protein
MRLRSSKRVRSVSPEPPATRGTHCVEPQAPAKRRRVAAIKSRESKHRRPGVTHQGQSPLAPKSILSTAKMRLGSSKRVRSVSPEPPATRGTHCVEPQVPAKRRRVSAVRFRGSKTRYPGPTSYPPSPPRHPSSLTLPRSSATSAAEAPAPVSPPPSIPSGGPSAQREPSRPSPPPLPPRTVSWPKSPAPMITPVRPPKSYPALPVVHDFTCTFIRALESSEVCSVLLISLPDGTQRILKVGAPGVKGRVGPFITEYDAYTALLHHKVSRPPGSSPEPRVVPYCYGLLRLNDLRKQMRRASYWKSPIKRHLQNTHLNCLLLEYIPKTVTVAAEPERLSQRPHLATALLDALRSIHAAGVYHRDPLPRNMLLDENDGVWWIDFGQSYNTAFSNIDDGWFIRELSRVEYLLLGDVIPAVRNGTIASWVRFGQ